MLITILFLVLLFLAGLIGTNFPTKKFLAWFRSFCVQIRNPSDSSHAANKFEKIPDDRKAAAKGKAAGNNKLHLRSVFATFDKNSDGYITKQELRDSLNSIGMAVTEKDIADMVTNVDSNGDGLIDLDEFCESFDSLMGRGGDLAQEEQGKDIGNDDEEVGGDGDLKEAFDVFDGDKDGVITVEELGMVLSSLGFKEGNKLEDCKEMIRKVDIDGDGMVNFDEFKKMMKAGQMLVPVS